MAKNAQIAKQVISVQKDGLEALEAVVSANEFSSLVDKISALNQAGKGRVIVSGMGKSGHIARKIAATLSSTGTPSFFVHPGEASHGDLGMIDKHDIVILLSNSGETAELGDIIAYCNRYKIFLVGMVRKQTSKLVEASDIALVLPEVPEANNVGAPVTSTTMMLVLGDCLAVCLLEGRSFAKEDFKVYHPGGKLGAAFTTVEQIMHSADAMPVVSQNDSMEKAILEITGKKFGCTFVVEDGKLVGIITDGDLRRNMGKDLIQKTVAKVMGGRPQVIRKAALAGEALAIMNDKKITCMPVVDKDGSFEPTGIIHIHDILQAGVS